jgi:hypothetical protein
LDRTLPICRLRGSKAEKLAKSIQLSLYNPHQEVHLETKQAKDFLADQAAQQAALERTPLSDVERRMMYFTENDPTSCDNPANLNDEFEETYDTAEYEEKMSGLLRRAYKRLGDENTGAKLQWDEATSTLEQGDHYILVLLNTDSKLARQGLLVWKVLAWGVGLGIALVILLMLGIILNHYWNNSR